MDSDGTAEHVFSDQSLTGARFRHVRLNDARFREVDFSGASMRGVDFSGVEIDGWIDGLVINGIDVAPLVTAELFRREPARALMTSDDVSDLREAWNLLQGSWAASYDRVAGMPAGTVGISIDDEWSYLQTLRHLILATDTWLGAATGTMSFHPWGMPFADMDEFADPVSLGITVDAQPSYDDVREVRASRVDAVRQFLADATTERLAEERSGPPWADKPVSALRCIRVILEEECEHLRFATRDLDAIEARAAAKPAG